MKIPLFKITIYYDEETKMFVPEYQETPSSQKFDKHDKVGLIQQCTDVIIKQIKQQPETKEEN